MNGLRISGGPSAGFSLPGFSDMGFSNEDVYSMAILLLIPLGCGLLALCFMLLKRHFSKGHGRKWRE